jgi:hypothetical protein
MTRRALRGDGTHLASAATEATDETALRSRPDGADMFDDRSHADALRPLTATPTWGRGRPRPVDGVALVSSVRSPIPQSFTGRETGAKPVADRLMSSP